MTNSQRILVIEDNGGLRRLLMDVIAAEPDFLADGAGSIAEAEALVADPRLGHAAILLDLSLPDGDGRGFCRSLRRRGITVPILVLTGATSEQDIAETLDCGASLYLTKPIRMGELMTRLREMLPHRDHCDEACDPVASLHR